MGILLTYQNIINLEMDESDGEEDQIINSYWRDIPDKFSHDGAFSKDNSFIEPTYCKIWSQQNTAIGELSSMVVDYWVKRITTEKQILLSTIKSEMISMVAAVGDLINSGYCGHVSLLESNGCIISVYNKNNDDEKQREQAEKQYYLDRKGVTGSEHKTALEYKAYTEVI